MRVHLIVNLCVLVLALTGRAAAWNFPEHAEVTRLAYDHRLPAPMRAVLAKVALVASESLPLCKELTRPLARLRESDGCLPVSVLPALAGDHSIDALGLRDSILRIDAQQPTLAERLIFAVVPLFGSFLADAPPDVARLYRSDVTSDSLRGDGSSDALRRSFLRRLDLRLQSLDAGYSNRAEGSLAHFQDATKSIDELLHAAAGAGDLDNALAQALAHHARSLQLAVQARDQNGQSRARLSGEAILEHAFALHFLQDAFAAGHIGTEASVEGGISRLRRHDFLNRVGLSVTRVFSTRGCHSPSSSFASGDDCWIAYGDGYLDWNNASLLTEAISRFAAQLAVAADPTLISELVQSCQPPAKAGAGDRALSDQLSPAQIEGSTPNAKGKIQVEGPHVVHLYQERLAEASPLEISLSSTEFDTYLEVRRRGVDSWRNDDVSVISTDSSIGIPFAAPGDYEIRVSAVKAEVSGTYALRIDRTPPRLEQCDALLEAYALLDPAPVWSLGEAERTNRAAWTERDAIEVAIAVVRGVDEATATLGKVEALVTATAGAGSGATPGTLPDSVVGRPLAPCDPAPAWQQRHHPLCPDQGSAFRGGSPDASLWRPLLVIWPGPSGDIRVIEGEDSFGVGLAAQVLFGIGGMAALEKDVPAALVPFFVGGGASLRVDSLFPTRVNRELVAFDFGLAPAFTAGLNNRYALLFGLEARIPVWAAFGAWVYGREWTLGRMELGPTGARAYWEMDNGHPGEFLGYDVEIFNVPLSGISAVRTASIGAAMDTELRFRLGRVRLRELDNPDSRFAWFLGFEIASGYSVFLTH